MLIPKQLSKIFVVEPYSGMNITSEYHVVYAFIQLLLIHQGSAVFDLTLFVVLIANMLLFLVFWCCHSLYEYLCHTSL